MTKRTRTLSMATVAVAGAVLLAVAAIVVTTAAQRLGGSESDAAAAVTPGERAEAAAVLRTWDEARARAWAEADAAGLRGLYVAGSVSGEQDVAMLEDWAGRGLRVEGMRMQVSSVEVIERGEDRLELLVTDRLAEAVAVRDTDGTTWPLPRDRESTRRLVFRRTAEAWRLETAYDRPVANIDDTSGSANE